MIEARTSRNPGEPVNNRRFTLPFGSTSCGNRPVRRANLPISYERLLCMRWTKWRWSTPLVPPDGRPVYVNGYLVAGWELPRPNLCGGERMAVRREASRYLSLPNDGRPRCSGVTGVISVNASTARAEIVAYDAADIMIRVVPPPVGNQIRSTTFRCRASSRDWLEIARTPRARDPHRPS